MGFGRISPLPLSGVRSVRNAVQASSGAWCNRSLWLIEFEKIIRYCQVWPVQAGVATKDHGFDRLAGG
ncbi:MAG: hypothetical protein KatS3mg058_1208 [Roseiflexus sp.]|nr:MAG: hypothetical protein KatS3mg058_1208 [Roseiflexus sp.]